MEPAARYFAYVSYSHKDARWAEWLHRRIEGYRVPRRLTDNNRHPKRLRPIFRDRVELPSSNDLGDAIDKALRQSEALIVICSPSAAQSRWVNEEIYRFKQLGRSDRIFCLIVDGDPTSDSNGCFPGALLGEEEGGHKFEPLAADVRLDGKSSALLKVIAGLLTVGFDDLKQRDLQKKLRVMVLVATFSIFLTLLLAALTTTTYLARREAEVSRNQAEDLVGFMLTDLRSRLEPIGRIGVLDVVADKAMKYFAALSDSDVTDKALTNRSLALRQIGEVRMLQGSYDKALSTFGEALAISQLLSESKPDDVERLFELGQIQFWVGYSHWEKLNYDAAETAFQEYLSTAQILISLDGTEPRWMMEAAYANQNLGSLYLRKEKYKQAHESFESASKVFELLVEIDPDNRNLRGELANAYSWLGSTFYELGELEQSTNYYGKDVGIYRSIVLDGTDKNIESRLAEQLLLLGYIHLVSHQTDMSVQLINEAEMYYRDLTSRDPQNMRWQRNGAVTQLYKGLIYSSQERWSEAIDELEQAYVSITKVLAQSESVVYQVDAAEIANAIAEVNLWTGNFDEAMTWANHSKSRLAAIERQSPDFIRELVRAYLVIAEIDSDAESSEKLMAEANQLLAGRLQKSQNPDYLALFAEVSLHTGETDVAENALNRLARIGYQPQRLRRLKGRASSSNY